ncbi:MAG: DNA-3-methyladenine glycosylase [Verrucomicrobia bacterium]|nr:DNA-3-methyladenine glycosylase [Verrucomicrobiota bacterium]
MPGIGNLQPLPREFYDRDTVSVARDLLGKLLVHRRASRDLVGRIVETEAYLGPHDLAAHSCRGLTERTRVMFGPPGHAYVYLVYGMHHCMNVVTEPAGHGAAVLLRAVEPVRGITRRSSGPGLLCRAMEIDRRLNARDLTTGSFFIADSARADSFAVTRRPRVGVDYAGHWARRLLRFYIRGNAFISRP